MSADRHTFQALAAATSLLVVGVVLGLALDRFVLIPAHAGAAVVTLIHSPGAGEHDETLRQLGEDLELTDEQATRVGEIFRRHQGSINAAWSAMRSHFAMAIDSATIEVETVLDEGQIEKLHAWVTERHGAPPPHTLEGGS